MDFSSGDFIRLKENYKASNGFYYLENSELIYVSESVLGGVLCLYREKDCIPDRGFHTLPGLVVLPKILLEKSDV